MKIGLIIAAIYFAAVGVAQQISTNSNDSPTADQIGQLPSITGAGGMFNLILALGLFAFASGITLSKAKRA